jgi:hypothetical protein
MDITNILQTNIKQFVDASVTMYAEVKDISKAYWATDANTKISGLANDTDAATLSTKLTKVEYITSITFVAALENFFGNSAVGQSDYMVTCNKLKYGSHATGAKLSEATEQLGSRMNLVALNAIEMFKWANNILTIYASNEVGDMIANIDAQRHIPGSQMNKDELNSGITLVEQFKKIINNEVVATGDYASTLAKWSRL